MRSRQPLHPVHRLLPGCFPTRRRRSGLPLPALAAWSAIGALAILAAAGRAQTPPRPAPPRHDAQNAYEPRTGPGAGQVLLARFAGDWDVVKTFYPQQGEPVRTAGECRQAMVHDGHFLQSDFTFADRDGGKTTG
ncbi:MAG TPA: hypothetical protein VKY89_06420 [Thermoanaerobaculia bacterium]|nr:hypothetical protein [Thermoanaerobaculia bacterium]